MKHLLLALALLLLAAPALSHDRWPDAGGGGASSQELSRLAARSFGNSALEKQICSATTERCPDPNNYWAINQWSYMARSPAMRPDLGVNGGGSSSTAWEGTVDSVNDLIRQIGVADGSFYTYTLTTSETQWATSGVNVPEAAGAALCRLSGSPFTECTSGGTCSSVPTTGQPEVIVIKKVPEARYYITTVGSVTNCSVAGDKTLTLNDGWPITTDSTDQIQLFMPDGVHPGQFATYWTMQNILEARQEVYYQPAENLVAQGDMEVDCVTSFTSTLADLTTANGTVAQTTYNVDARTVTPAAGSGAGSVMGNACLWSAQAAGAVLSAQPVAIRSGEPLYIRWHQRTPDLTTSAVGIRVMYDADGDGVFETDICEYGGGTTCLTYALAMHIDHPDLSGITFVPTDPDGGGAIPPAFYPNDNGVAPNLSTWCRDWCWNMLKITVPTYVNIVQVQFVVEGAATNVGIDEVQAFYELNGAPATNFGTWLIPPGSHSWLASGDSRCANDPFTVGWDLAFSDVRNSVQRAGLFMEFKHNCTSGATTKDFLRYGFGCTSVECGSAPGTVFSIEASTTGASPSPMTLYYPSIVTTLLGINDPTSFGTGTVAFMLSGLKNYALQTSLTAAYTGGATMTVSSISGFPDLGGRLMIGQEMFSYTGAFAGAFSGVTRGFSGTPQYNHAIGEVVTFFPIDGIVRRNGAKHIVVGPTPWRGSKVGNDGACVFDASQEDCSEFTQSEAAGIAHAAN